MNRFEGGGGSDSSSDICKCNEDWKNKIKNLNLDEKNCGFCNQSHA